VAIQTFRWARAPPLDPPLDSDNDVNKPLFHLLISDLGYYSHTVMSVTLSSAFPLYFSKYFVDLAKILAYVFWPF